MYLRCHDLLDRRCPRHLARQVCFPDKALAAAELIRSSDYSGLSEQELCERLTADLFTACADKLTSSFTFSAGEELCYNLQTQRRAVLIGQTTRGGAHPTDSFPLSDTVEITVPIARSVNPITGTNWEGVGVRPDIEVPEEQAFPHAYRLALEHVIANSESAAVVDEARTAIAEMP